MGFCKILSHPHMEPKTQARTESDGIAPLTYCSDMQIPSLPLKTESTSTFKANFGFIVHVARWSAAAQHSWLARAPADAVPGSSRPLRPRVLGTAAGRRCTWGGGTQGARNPKRESETQRNRDQREREREKPERKRPREEDRDQGERKQPERERAPEMGEQRPREKERPRDGGQRPERGTGVGDGAGLWTEKPRPPACHFSGLSLTPPPLASCPTTLEASLACSSCPLDSSHSRLVDRAHVGHSAGGQCGKCPLQDGETEAQSAPHPHICRLLPLPAPLQLLTRPRPLC